MLDRYATGMWPQKLGRTRLKAEKTILDMSREQLLRDRAMLMMQGFERDPAALPSIESLLGVPAITV